MHHVAVRPCGITCASRAVTRQDNTETAEQMLQILRLRRAGVFRIRRRGVLSLRSLRCTAAEPLVVRRKRREGESSGDETTSAGHVRAVNNVSRQTYRTVPNDEHNT